METPKADNALWKKYRSGIYRLLDLEILPIGGFLRPKDNVVFDVGGNIGLWSIALAEGFPDRIASVDVFEPSPSAMRIANQFHIEGIFGEISTKIRFHNTAVGATPGKGLLHFDESDLTLSTLTGAKTQLPQREISLTKSVEVPIVIVDEFCEAKNVDRIDYMKVDTEGFEMEVLLGARKMLERKAIGAICFEFGLSHIERRQFFKDFWEFFTPLGYKLHWLKRGENGFNTLPIPEYTTRWESFQFNRYFIASAPR